MLLPRDYTFLKGVLAHLSLARFVNLFESKPRLQFLLVQAYALSLVCNALDAHGMAPSLYIEPSSISLLLSLARQAHH